MSEFVLGPSYTETEVINNLGRFTKGSSVRALMNICKIYGGFMAGGFPVSLMCGNKNFSDIDIFFKDAETLQKAVEFACVELGVYAPDEEDRPYFGETTNSHTFYFDNQKVQFIKIVTGEVKEILNTFDFDNSKLALVYNQATGLFDSIMASNLPELIKEKKISFRRQINVSFTDEETKETFAYMNFDRLEKYLGRFPGGFVDAQSREHILLQYAWDLNNGARERQSQGYVAPRLYALLTQPETTLEELILFFSLGGKYKEIFRSKTGRFEPDMVNSQGNSINER